MKSQVHYHPSICLTLQVHVQPLLPDLPYPEPGLVCLVYHLEDQNLMHIL